MTLIAIESAAAAEDDLSYLDDEGSPDLASYDRFVCFFSTGKDSLASVLHLLEWACRRARSSCTTTTSTATRPRAKA